jgi:predicted GNAT family N-acyltransferase
VTATHFLVRANPGLFDNPTGIIGTARLVDKDNGVGKVGRVAIAPEQRGKGVGALLMQFVEQTAREQGFSRLVLDAQIDAIPFYEKLGYLAEGDIFLDAGIEHRFMSKSLPPIGSLTR